MRAIDCLVVALRVVYALRNVGLYRRTRPVRHFREWSDTRDRSSRHFPSPGPSPSGQGTARIARWNASGSGLYSAPRRAHPLPEGEGRGEGKETTAPRSLDVLALERG